MRVAIHQPNYLPWLGYFYKMVLCDVFIILDTAQFTKNGYQNRVKIKTPQGAQWLTQPVRLDDGSFKPTNEIRFADNKWGAKHVKTIQSNYGRSLYFNDYFTQLKGLLDSVEENLSRFNFKLIKWIIDMLGIECSIYIASECNSKLTATKRLVELIKWVGGDTYVAGKGSENYQDNSLFEKEKIKLEVTKFKPVPYSQLWGEFIPGLSIIDILFNCGPHSLDIIKKCRNT